MSQRGGNRGYGGGGSSGGGLGGGGRGFTNGGGGNSGRGYNNSPRDSGRPLPPMKPASKPYVPISFQQQSIRTGWKIPEDGIFKPPTNNSVGTLKCRTIDIEVNYIKAFQKGPDRIRHQDSGAQYVCNIEKLAADAT